MIFWIQIITLTRNTIVLMTKYLFFLTTSVINRVKNVLSSSFSMRRPNTVGQLSKIIYFPQSCSKEHNAVSFKLSVAGNSIVT